jgi:hypothetical protein
MVGLKGQFKQMKLNGVGGGAGDSSVRESIKAVKLYFTFSNPKAIREELNTVLHCV